MAPRLVDIRDTPLSVDECLAAIRSPAVGGIVLFVGVVRDDDNGRKVTTLDYDGHPTAKAVLQTVVDEIQAAFPMVEIAATHRVGTLAVGDTAVVLAVGAPHRGEAFQACRRLIDELKDRVPIWKHQLFTDGSAEWVGSL